MAVSQPISGVGRRLIVTASGHEIQFVFWIFFSPKSDFVSLGPCSTANTKFKKDSFYFFHGDKPPATNIHYFEYFAKYIGP